MNRIALRHLLVLVMLLLNPACSQSAPSDDEKAVRAHLEHYFATWSAQDMDGYAACFHPQARISFNLGEGRMSNEGLTDFVHGQRMSHQTAASPMKEVPLDMKISTGKAVAQAAVKWELHKADGNKTGTDFFTLARTPDGWRILALVWEQD